MMADIFDEAFAEGDRNEDLARLIGSVIRMNLWTGAGDIRIDDQVYEVGPGRCEVCGTWVGECIHRRAMALAIRAEEQAREDDRQDLYETYNTALGVGVQ